MIEQLKDSLQTIPSIKYIVDTVKIQSTDTMELVSKVDQFYNNAWDKLIWIIGALITVVGIIIPLVSQRYQRKAQEDNKSKLEEQFNAKFAKAKYDLEEASRVRLLEMETKINYVISSRVKTLEAELAYIQKNYEDAAYLHTIAAREALLANDIERAIVALETVSFYLIAIDPKLYLERFTKNGETMQNILEQIQSLSKNNDKVRKLLEEIDLHLFRLI